MSASKGLVQYFELVVRFKLVLLGRTLVNFKFTFDKIIKVFDNLSGKYDKRMCVRVRACAYSWHQFLNWTVFYVKFVI